MTKAGFASISSTMDSDHAGHMIIVVQNIGRHAETLEYGEPFCTMVLFHNVSPSTKGANNPYDEGEIVKDLINTWSSQAEPGGVGTNVFIGHGRSPLWKDLKDFVHERLRLPWDEFNHVPVAGVTNTARLSEMLAAAAIAFVVMTAEDEQADGQTRARMNVIHEAGLFQGRLGFTKAIIIVEEGCAEFSNIHGLGQIRFPKGNIKAVFEEVRQVLEREGLLA